MNKTKENNKEESVFGLTIYLKKYSLGKVTRGIQNEPNIILGHYDSILITPISKWLDYANIYPLKNTNESDPTSRYVKRYPIRLLFPSDDIIKKYGHFHYNAWKEYEGLLQENNCMTLVLVNLTDEYKENVENDLLENFLDLLSNDTKIRGSLSDVYFVALPSMGYSDFCVLMCSKEWKQPMELVELLHGLTDKNNIPVMSTDYMIPVYHFNSKDDFDPDCFNDIGMSVRVNIKPGVTAHMLKAHIPKDVEVYRTSGSTDCLLRAKGKGVPKQLFDFLISSNKNQTNSFVVDMESTLQLPVDLDDASGSPLHSSTWHERDIDLLHTLGEQIKRYGETLEKSKRNRLQLNDLYELLTNIENIYAEYHTEAVCGILRGFIRNFSYCLSLCADDMEKENPEYNFDEMEEQINELCNIVNNFLLDLSRSDCFFIEKERYSHSSVSSITSLLIAYNQWLNAFTNEVQSATKPDNKSDFKFLVTSGNQDQTETFNPFSFLNHNIKERPLIILMSDISPFDFSGTILRAVHECMHFCGERYRQERVKYLGSFVTMMLAQNISELIFPVKPMCKYIQEIYLTLCLDADKKQYILNEVEKICCGCSVQLTKGIQNVLENCLNTEEFAGADEKYLLRNVKRWMYKTLLKAFSVYVFDVQEDEDVQEDGQVSMHLNKFFEDIYDQTQEVYIKLNEENIALANDNDIDTLIFSFEINKIKLYLNYTNEYEMDILIRNQIQLILSRLLISIPAYADISYDKDWEYSFPYYSLTQKNILDVLDVATDIFSETFSDVMACKILKVTLEDYLLAYIYEDWDLDSALPCEETKIYRISAVINICFNEHLNDDCTELNEGARAKIEDAILRFTNHGMPTTVDCKALCDRVDELLYSFQCNRMIGDPLIEYLKHCISQYNNNKIFSQLNCFSSSFNEIKLLNIAPNESNAHEKLIKMYYALINNEWNREGKANDGDVSTSKMR